MSESKQKGSLAALAQKKKGVQKLKTILCQPFPRYMPKIDLEDCKAIKDLILNDREEYKQSNYKKNRGINTGLNSIIRLLKNNKISCLLLSSGMKPFSITIQIITLAICSSQPAPHILYVPNLNEILKEIFHIDSFALACVRDKFKKLEEYMKIKCSEFPLPNKLLAYHGLKQIEPKQPVLSKIFKEKTNDKVDFNELYVIKSHAYSSRSFYPKNAINLKPLKFEEPQEFSGNYISFSNTEDNMEKDCINNTNNYKADKQNLINCMKKHLPTTSADVKLEYQEKIFKKKRNECKNKVAGNLTKNSMTQYQPLKIKKIHGNPTKKKSKIKNK